MASQTAVFGDGQQHISGGNFMSGGNIHLNQHFNNRGLEPTGFTKLTNNVAPSALHDSGEISEPPKCHPGTRVDVLTILVTWALLSIYEYPIRWLNGPAGAGKSAIMRSFAQMLVQKGLLLASFFFFRSDGRRNTVERLISTIAYQLCINVPPLQPWVERAIEVNPLIFKASISVQVQALIIDPFLRYFYTPNSIIITPFPRIILIDGLDECAGDENQQEILQTFRKMVETLPIPIAIVFASRPEHQIRIAFELGSLNTMSSRITLDESFNPDEDIRRFYLAEFATIQSTHPMRSHLGATVWPSPEVIQMLVCNASGQFIYAATVVKFVKSNRHNPAVRLQIVLGQVDRGRSKPFQQLDALYTVIFLNVDPEALPDTLRVLGIILTPAKPNHQSPIFLETLLGFPAGHIQFLLLDLESLLTVTENEKDIRIYHTSLSDFLFDKSRAEGFFTDRGLVYADIALSSIGLICHPSFSQLLLESYFEAQILVSLQNATPTDGLHHAIVSCDMDQLIGFPQSKRASTGTLALYFLVGLKGSLYSDAERLFEMKFPPFRRFINPTLTNHWLRGDNFMPSILFVLLLALTPSLPTEIGFLLGYLFIAGAQDGISILPTLSYKADSDGAIRTSASWHLLASLILKVIDSPTGFLHDQRGKTACTDFALHLVEVLSSMTRIRSSPSPDQMDKVLPALLNASLARNDLIAAVQHAQRGAPSDSPYLKSMTMTFAINSYIQRAGNGGDNHSESSEGGESLVVVETNEGGCCVPF